MMSNLQKLLVPLSLCLLIFAGCSVQDSVDSLVEDVNSSIEDAAQDFGEEIDAINADLEDLSEDTGEAVEEVESALDEATNGGEDSEEDSE